MTSQSRDTSERLAALPERERRGSRPRCLLLTTGAPEAVAARLTGLAASWASVSAGRDRWMPRGFDAPEEALLDRVALLTDSAVREKLTRWWLAKPEGANTPNWDVAATATIDGRPGLVLVEAKAHDAELSAAGKASGGNPANHERIGAAIAEANVDLDAVCPGWRLSRDSHYQLANRVAWSWKLATLGFPVVLVYLGFINATEMSDQGRPFKSGADWDRVVRDHARGVVPDDAWGRPLGVGAAPLVLTTAALDVRLPTGSS